MSADALELTVESLGARGDAVAHRDGKPVFVAGALPGERVRARLLGRRGEGEAAELVEILSASPDRVAPRCRHFGVCGGCAAQHLADAAYANWKRGLLVEALGRIGIADSLIAPLVRTAPGVRRRASWNFVRRKADTVLGYAQRASETIVDIAECPVLAPALTALMAPLRAALTRAFPSGVRGDAIATRTETGTDLLIECAAAPGAGARAGLANFAQEQDLARIAWRKPGGAFEPIAQWRMPRVTFAGIAVEPPPGAFLQPSAEGEAALAALVTEAVGKADPVADLYAGCGSFAFPLAQGRRVHAVEGDKGALAALLRAARAPGLSVTGEARDLTRRPLMGNELKPYQAVVFDPPRAGAAAQARALAESGPKIAVAVSCNPTTLARDAKTLIDGGYRPVRATPVDQFLWSARLEAVAIFTRE